MGLTPDEIAHRAFTPSADGYHKGEVRTFLERISGQLQVLLGSMPQGQTVVPEITTSAQQHEQELAGLQAELRQAIADLADVSSQLANAGAAAMATPALAASGSATGSKELTELVTQQQAMLEQLQATQQEVSTQLALATQLAASSEAATPPGQDADPAPPPPPPVSLEDLPAPPAAAAAAVEDPPAPPAPPAAATLAPDLMETATAPAPPATAEDLPAPPPPTAAPAPPATAEDLPAPPPPTAPTTAPPTAPPPPPAPPAAASGNSADKTAEAEHGQTVDASDELAPATAVDRSSIIPRAYTESPVSTSETDATTTPHAPAPPAPPAPADTPPATPTVPRVHEPETLSLFASDLDEQPLFSDNANDLLDGVLDDVMGSLNDEGTSS